MESGQGGAIANGKNILPVLLYLHHGSRQHVFLEDTAGGGELAFAFHYSFDQVTQHAKRKGKKLKETEA